MERACVVGLHCMCKLLKAQNLPECRYDLAVAGDHYIAPVCASCFLPGPSFILSGCLLRLPTHVLSGEIYSYDSHESLTVVKKHLMPF